MVVQMDCWWVDHLAGRMVAPLVGLMEMMMVGKKVASKVVQKVIQ